jgi:signal transduction histidine kinase/CheY-like chemotaxis protein
MQNGSALRLRTIAVGAALILAFVGSALYDSWRLHQQLSLANERELGNLSKALAAEASTSIGAVDSLLLETVDWYEGHRSERDPDTLTAALATRATGVTQVSVLSLVNADGMQVARSRVTGAPLAEVADRPYYLRHRETPDLGLFINEPIVTRTERVPSVVLSRRLNGPTGRFDGVVTAIVTLEQLQHAYGALDLGGGASLVLTLGDGTLVARQPHIPGMVGRKFPELVLLKGGQQIDTLVSPVDGRIKLVSAVGVPGQGLVLAVTRDEAEVMMPWRDEMRSAIIRTALLSLAVFLTISWLLRQMRRQAELEAKLQQAHKLEALGTLAGGIAHDFNNILGAILGFGEMAQRQATPGTPIRRHIDRVMQSGARARLLVRRILDFSRNSVAERVPVNLQAVVEEVVAMLSPSLPAGLTVQAQLESGSAAVIGDATQLHQVVMNLCANAVQAMGDEGVVRVSLTRMELQAARSLRHGELRPGDFVCLAVADTGSGVSPEVLERMFDPFFTTKKSGDGTGLGLSVVHGIVSDLGGGIDVAANTPRGTVVTVWLPVCGEVAAPSGPHPVDWPKGRGQTVMVVDDERPLLELAEELLAGLDYEPVGYDSAEAALAAFEADPHRFDAVLTDQSLPGMPGDELVERLLAVRPGMPILLMSGNLGADVEQRLRRRGVRAVLHKPLALQDLAENLSAAVGTAD